MLFKILEIDLDLTEGCPHCGGSCYQEPLKACDGFIENASELLSYKREIVNKIMSMEWIADDADDLAKEISSASGEIVAYMSYEEVDVEYDDEDFEGKFPDDSPIQSQIAKEMIAGEIESD